MRSFSFLVVVLFLVGCASTSKTNLIVIPEKNLLLHYDFNGDVLDKSGNEYHGSSFSNFAKSKNGAGRAAVFNGIDQSIEFRENLELQPDLPVSFYFLVKFDDLDPENSTLLTTDYEEDNHSGIWMGISSGGEFYVSIGDARGVYESSRRTFIGTKKIKTNTWYSIAVVVSSLNKVELFIDDKKIDGRYSGKGERLQYTPGPGTLGKKDGNIYKSPYYFQGMLDEFMYWDRRLTREEISELNNNWK